MEPAFIFVKKSSYFLSNDVNFLISKNLASNTTKVSTSAYFTGVASATVVTTYIDSTEAKILFCSRYVRKLLS